MGVANPPTRRPSSAEPIDWSTFDYTNARVTPGQGVWAQSPFWSGTAGSNRAGQQTQMNAPTPAALALRARMQAVLQPYGQAIARGDPDQINPFIQDLLDNDPQIQQILGGMPLQAALASSGRGTMGDAGATGVPNRDNQFFPAYRAGEVGTTERIGLGVTSALLAGGIGGAVAGPAAAALSTTGGAAAGGAAAGAAGGAIATGAQDGGMNDLLRNMGTGAAIGGVTGGVASGLSGATSSLNPAVSGAIRGGVTGGINPALRGGGLNEILEGMASGAVGGGVSGSTGVSQLGSLANTGTRMLLNRGGGGSAPASATGQTNMPINNVNTKTPMRTNTGGQPGGDLNPNMPTISASSGLPFANRQAQEAFYYGPQGAGRQSNNVPLNSNIIVEPLTGASKPMPTDMTGLLQMLNGGTGDAPLSSPMQPTATAGAQPKGWFEDLLTGLGLNWSANRSEQDAETARRVADPFGPQRDQYQQMLQQFMGQGPNGAGGGSYDQMLQQMLNNGGSSNRLEQFTDAGGPTKYHSMLEQLMTGGSNAIADRPGYQFRLDQGMKALDRRNNAMGMLNSGNSSFDIMNYAQGLASTEFAAEEARLQGLAGMESTDWFNKGNMYSNVDQLANQNFGTRGQLALGGMGQGDNRTANWGNLLSRLSGADSSSPAAAANAWGMQRMGAMENMGALAQLLGGGGQGGGQGGQGNGLTGLIGQGIKGLGELLSRMFSPGRDPNQTFDPTKDPAWNQYNDTTPFDGYSPWAPGGQDTWLSPEGEYINPYTPDFSNPGFDPAIYPSDAGGGEVPIEWGEFSPDDWAGDDGFGW